MVLKYGKHLYFPMSQPKSLAEHCFLSTCLVPGLNSGLASQVFASCELWEVRGIAICAAFQILQSTWEILGSSLSQVQVNWSTQSKLFQRNCDTHHNCARYSSRQAVLQDSAEFLAAANRYHTINRICNCSCGQMLLSKTCIGPTHIRVYFTLVGLCNFLRFAYWRAKEVLCATKALAAQGRYRTFPISPAHQNAGLTGSTPLPRRLRWS